MRSYGEKWGWKDCRKCVVFTSTSTWCLSLGNDLLNSNYRFIYDKKKMVLKEKKDIQNFWDSLIQKFKLTKLSKWKIVPIVIKWKLLTDYREWSEMFNSKKQPVSLFESGVWPHHTELIFCIIAWRKERAKLHHLLPVLLSRES